jgi:hypothetical protein
MKQGRGRNGRRRRGGEVNRRIRKQIEDPARRSHKERNLINKKQVEARCRGVDEEDDDEAGTVDPYKIKRREGKEKKTFRTGGRRRRSRVIQNVARGGGGGGGRASFLFIAIAGIER